MPAGIDVLGLGAVAVDDLFFLDEFPKPDAKVRVVASERQAGGLTGTALVAAARLGSSAAYAGTLGEDDLSRFIVDHSGLRGMLRAARIARSAGIAVVGDFEHRHPGPFEELFALTDHLVLPIEFARLLTGAADGPTAAEALWNETRAAVVVTVGAEGAWYVSAEHPGGARHQPAFRVEAVDTTGCGDVFHGAYAAALSRGLGVADRVRVASAAAAIKATRPGGQKGIPSAAEIGEFLKRPIFS
jgi:sugar/nucleoside kinase (ribokinase family)